MILMAEAMMALLWWSWHWLANYPKAERASRTPRSISVSWRAGLRPTAKIRKKLEDQPGLSRN